MKTKLKTAFWSIYYGVLSVAFVLSIMSISWNSGYSSRLLEETREDVASIQESLDGMLEITGGMIESTDDMIESIEEANEIADGILEDL